MKEDETILEMFHRLQVIVNDLKGLGHKTQDQDFCHKFLLSLPRRFKMLIILLQRDGLDTMKPNDLLGEVLTYDKYDQDEDDKEKKEKQKKKTMAFKATTSKSKGKTKVQEDSDNEEDEDLEIDDEALALVVKKIGKLFIKRRVFRKRGDNFKSKEKPRLCFNCDSLDHLQAECSYEKKKNKKNMFEKKNREDKMTFKKGKDGAYMVTWDSDDEDDDEKDTSNEVLTSIAITKRPSLFDSSSSCFMAKETKVHDDDSSDSEVEYAHYSDNDDDDEPTKYQLYDMLQQTKYIAITKSKECKGLIKKVQTLEKALCELKASHECLVEDHEELGKAHSKFEEAHSLLLEQHESEKVIVSCDVGFSCDILDESFYQPIIMSSANPSCSSSSTTTNSTSTTSDGFTCDTSLMVENETLKR
jgi:hypothetical protein